MKNKKTSKNLSFFAKHIFIPHKANQYRPHLIRRYGLVSILLLLCVTQFAYGQAFGGKTEVLGDTPTVTIPELLQETNAERAKASLPALQLNQKLDAAAYQKAQDMLTNDYWGHVSPTGVQPWKWLGDTQYNYAEAGENLAKNYPSSQATVNAWMASPGHKANILKDSYSEVGFAVVDGILKGKNTSLVVAFYGKPAEAAIQGSSSPAAYAGFGNFNQPSSTSGSPLTYIGNTIQAMSSATLGALVVLSVGFAVSLASYRYRHQLPRHLKSTWYKHHGAYKAAGFAAVAAVVVGISTVGSGQL